MNLNSYSNWMRRELKKQGIDYHMPPPRKSTKWFFLAFLVLAVVVDLVLGHLLHIDERMDRSPTRPCACAHPWR